METTTVRLPNPAHYARRLGSGLKAFATEIGAKKDKTLPTDTVGAPPESYYPYWVSDEWALQTVDDLVQKRGSAVYRQMVDRDDQVSASIWLLILARLSSGWELQEPGSGKEDIEKRVTAFCREALTNRLEGTSVTRFMQDSYDALPQGFSVIEKRYREPETSGEWTGKQFFRTFKPIAQETVTYKRDEGGDIEPDGVWQSKNRQNVIPGLAPEYFNHLPRDRFILWSWRQRWGNPLGMSILRPAYRWYHIKDQLIHWWARYLEYYGMPYTYVITDKDMNKKERDGVLERLRLFQSQQRMTFPKGSEVHIEHPKGMSGAVQGFDSMIARCDRGIGRSCLQPALLMENAEVGSYGLGKSMKGVFYWVLHNLGETSGDEVMEEQILRPFVHDNFGDQAPVPKFIWKPFEVPDLVKLGNAFKAMAQIGFPLTKKGVSDLTGMALPEEDEETLVPQESEPDQGVEREAVEEEEGLSELALALSRAHDDDEVQEVLRRHFPEDGD